MSEQAKCTYCNRPIIGAPYVATILDRSWDDVRRRQYLRERQMSFCCQKCAGNYQMGCEG
jgi:hypothetical protein